MNLSQSMTTRTQTGWREQTQSVFASAEVGFKGAYYLTLTGRSDWPSQLAGPNSNQKAFFYPSVGASVVLSEIIPDMPRMLEYLKIRGSYASVGVAFERFIANPLYSWNSDNASWGGTLGDLYSLVDLKRDSNGKIYVDETGSVIKENISDSKDYIKLGSVLPKANLAWNNSFRFGNFNLGFLITARLGGIVYSKTQAMIDGFGVSEASAIARDKGGVLVNEGDRVNAQAWYQTVGESSPVPQYYTYSATNVRLQEASVGYTFPRKMLGNVCELTLQLVGKNLWMIYNKAPFDPESVATMNNYYQGIDYFMLPSTRNFGLNIKLKF